MAFGYLSHSTPPSTSIATPIAPYLPPTPPSPKQRPILGCKCPLHQPSSLLWLCDEFSCILQFVTAVTAVGVPLTLPTFLHSPHTKHHALSHTCRLLLLSQNAIRHLILAYKCLTSGVAPDELRTKRIAIRNRSLKGSYTPYLPPSTSTAPPVAPHLPPTSPSPKHRPILGSKSCLHLPSAVVPLLCDEL